MRALPNESEPLSRPELKWRGDVLLREAKDAAADAMVASLRREFFIQGKSYNLREVAMLTERAREASQAWQKVDGLLSELLLEVQRSSRGGGSNQ